LFVLSRLLLGGAVTQWFCVSVGGG